MTEQERIAAALAYQQAQQPAMMNPNLARQGARGRENMMPPTSIMDERYPAFKRNQEDVEKLMLGLDIVGSAIPLAGPAAKGAVALGKYAAPQIAQGLENYAFRTGMALPMDVWHGTPHRFPPTAKNPLGEFDPTKIGTGEGAQAYGYGHYLSEAPSVAKSYQGSVSAMHRASNKATGGEPTIAGKPINWDDPQQVAAFELSRHAGDRVAAADFHARTFVGGDKNEAVKLLRSNAELPKVDLPGQLYKIDLPDESVARMLDWDKPLSEQPHIQQAFTPEAMGLTLRNPENGFMAYVTPNGKPIGMQIKDVTPEEFRSRWLDRLAKFGNEEGGAGRAVGYLGGTSTSGDLASAVSQSLRQAGIPGIQYLDAGSRGAGTGTRNFVVFPGNEGLLNILGRE